MPERRAHPDRPHRSPDIAEAPAPSVPEERPENVAAAAVVPRCEWAAARSVALLRRRTHLRQQALSAGSSAALGFHAPLSTMFSAARQKPLAARHPTAIR